MQRPKILHGTISQFRIALYLCEWQTRIMGHIKEPFGVDFVVDPTPLTLADRKKISEVIMYYKNTGRKTSAAKSRLKARSKKTSPKKTTV